MQARDGGKHYVRSGAVAGAMSAVVFAVIHDIFISDIWYSVLMMMVAGALCGLCIGWSYALLTERPSIGAWLRYNLLYVALLALLGVTSVLLFEPVTTIRALNEADAPPHALIKQALPMTMLLTLVAASLVTLLYEWSWLRFGAILLTITVLVLLLRLNVSVIGLVFIPHGSLYINIELFALILSIHVAYAVVLTALERRSLLRGSSVQHATAVRFFGSGITRTGWFARREGKR